MVFGEYWGDKLRGGLVYAIITVKREIIMVLYRARKEDL
jgi:hypothetical protein